MARKPMNLIGISAGARSVTRGCCGDPTQATSPVVAGKGPQRRNTPITLLAKLNRSAMTRTI
jgi:hypothetical protein